VAGESVVIDVRDIGINLLDLLITTGSDQHKPPASLVPVARWPGRSALAPEGSGWEPADRMAYFVRAGSCA
jgi:NADPH2:quinone reductase